MDKFKTLNVLQSLDKKIIEICNAVNTEVVCILKWADELNEMMSTISTKNEEVPIKLPKTPSERRQRPKQRKNTIITKNSIMSSTLLASEISNMDTTISTRTRAARRALASQRQLLNTTAADDLLNIKQESTGIQQQKTNDSLGSETFVVPPTKATRTKPIRKKQQNAGIQGTQSKLPKTESLQSVELSDNNEDVEMHTPRADSTLEPSNSVLLGEPARRKISRSLSESPIQRPTKYSKTFTNTPVKEFSKNSMTKSNSQTPESNTSEPLERKHSRAPSGSPIQRPSKNSKTFTKSPVNDFPKTPPHNPDCIPSATFRISRLSSRSPVTRSTRILTPTETFNILDSAPQNIEPLTDKKVPSSTPKCSPETQLSLDQTEPVYKMPSTFPVDDLTTPLQKTPTPSKILFSGPGKTSTPRPNASSPLFDADRPDLPNENQLVPDQTEFAPETDDSFHSFDSNGGIGEKKKKKPNKENASLDNPPVEQQPENIRITRTKSKAMKEKLKEEANAEAKQQQDFSEFAKKLQNKAKQSAHKKAQLAALSECNSTSKHGHTPFKGFPASLMSKGKYQIMLSSTKKKPKTPLATLPNSTTKKPHPVTNQRDSHIRSVTKANGTENETKLRTNKNKEDAAAKKRQNVIQSKKEELKRKNELKHQLAMKQREKLEQEKYNNMIQSEKEKEERHKIILQERQMKLKEEVLKKKMITQQKIAETVERRRLEEEARFAKLKEIEAEEKRIALEKQKEQERLEKREKDRLALKKAREAYEMEMKRELELEKLRAEKAAKKGTDPLASTTKMQSACKKQRFGIVGDKKDWDYKPRHENDYGLEDEHSETESDDERDIVVKKSPPLWAKKVLTLQAPMLHRITLDMLSEYMSCPQKSPDIIKMFNMTPTKKIKRTSSAIWNTPTRE